MPEAWRPIRLLALIEAHTVSGPAKNLLEFCRISSSMFPNAITTTLATFVRDRRSTQFLDAAEAAGVVVHPIEERFPFDLKVLGQLRRVVTALDPDLVQTHGTKSHFLLRASALWRRQPWIAFHHGYTMDAFRTRVYNQLDRWSLRAASAVVTVCQPFKRQLVSRGVEASRISILHNAISADWLDACSAEISEVPRLRLEDAHRHLRRSERERVVLAVGRLSKEKSFADLIAALKHLRGLRPDLQVRLVILGDGPEKNRLQQAVQEADLEQCVTMTGHVRDVRTYYRSADVLAISSLSEGCPNALLEAMAAGLPVIATSVGGIPEIVADTGAALLVEPRSPAAMAGAIASVLSDPERASRMGGNGRKLVKQQHSPESRTRSLLELYSRCVSSRFPEYSIQTALKS